jgi:superfamily I DNA/RNA helicase
MSVVRSIRLSSEVEEVLRREAERREISFSQLVASILKKYAEWDRFTEKLGYVGNSSTLYKQLISAIPDDKLEELGVNSAKLIKDALLFLYKKADLNSFLQYMSLVTKYAWGSSVQYEQHADGKNWILTLHHAFGKRWSYAFNYHMQEAIRDITGLEPKIVSTENTLRIIFPIQPEATITA